MTCNQLIVLLNIYRGTFDHGRHPPDFHYLVQEGYIKNIADHHYQVTNLAREKIKSLLEALK